MLFRFLCLSLPMPSCLHTWISSACGVYTHPRLLVRKKRRKGRREKRRKITIRRTTSEGPMRIYEEARRDKTREENFSSRQRSISNKSRQESLYDKKMKAKMMVFFLSFFFLLLALSPYESRGGKKRERTELPGKRKTCLHGASILSVTSALSVCL